MTRYAVDETRNELVATWETGYGAVAVLVAPLVESIEPKRRLALAAELSGLSEALWRCYTHPASAAGSLEVNTEGWRRQRTRDGFSGVTGHIREPNLPDGNGNLIVSYDPVGERAHRVGRCLRTAADADLTAAVIADVEAEIGAVERAELGNLAGRSVQAVQLTRQDASPVQVAAADKILAKDPLGGDELFVGLDPTSACVAAAHWLRAAAEVVADVSGIAPTNTVMESDNIEALPHATPTAVLELVEMGLSPTVAVTGLIRDALAVAEGDAPDIDALRDKIEEAEQDAERYGQGDPEAVAELMKVRLTTLDPRRPARDMLEDLLSGIRGCWLLYREYAELPGGEAGTDDDVSGDDISDDDVSDDDVSGDDMDDAIDAAFCDAVRTRASADRYRLDLEPPPASVVNRGTAGDGRSASGGLAGQSGAASTEAVVAEHEVDINLEAEDTCEHLVRLVLETDEWELPRDLVATVFEHAEDDAGRLVTSLIARAVGYLVSFKESAVSEEQIDTAVNWLGTRHGAEYAGPAAVAAALAGHHISHDMLATRLGVKSVSFKQLADVLGDELFPAMIWLCCGMVATTGGGDVGWLRQHRIWRS